MGAGEAILYISVLLALAIMLPSVVARSILRRRN